MKIHSARLIPRIEWDKEFKENLYLTQEPVRVVLHHSEKPTTGEWLGAESIIQILNFHKFKRGWVDIGYHFLISPDGKEVFLGRNEDAEGTHCGGVLPEGVKRNFSNMGSIAICLIGNYDIEHPDPNALKTISELISSLCKKYGLDDLNDVFGHCEAWTRAPKTCPGRQLFEEIFGSKRWDKLIFGNSHN